MSLPLLALLCLSTIIHAQTQGTPMATAFRNEPLSAAGDFVFEWIAGKNPQDPFTIRITGRSRGWLGVGFSPNGAMKNSDIVLCWFDQNGQPQISDRHGPSNVANGYPPADAQQNHRLVGANRNGSFMTFELTRPMDTCDSNDYQVSSGTVQIIYAANDIPPVSADNFQQHTVRGGKAVRLLDPPAMPPTDYTAYVDILAEGVHVPQNQSTLYFCRAYPAKKFPMPLQMIGYDMHVQPGNEKHVHHILFYGCTGNNTQALLNVKGDCFGEAEAIDRQCNDYIGGWAVGGQPFTYPSNMGKQYFGELYDVIGAQWHYDNSDGDSGIVDNSSMRVYLTDKLRPVKVGGLVLGAATRDTNIVIPPNQSQYKQQYLCTWNCTKNMPTSINIMSGLLHAHLSGISIRVRQIRNGRELPNPIADDNYDFNYQTPVIRFNNPAVMQPGDDLILECTFDTTGRTNATLGGIATHQEMCLAFLDFYPAGDRSVLGCQSALVADDLIAQLGGSNYTGENDNPEFDNSTLLYNGQNVTYLNWINSLPWTANNNALANKLENYVMNAPQYIMCLIPPQNSSTSGSGGQLEKSGFSKKVTTFMASPPKGFTPYVAVDEYCARRG